MIICDSIFCIFDSPFLPVMCSLMNQLILNYQSALQVVLRRIVVNGKLVALAGLITFAVGFSNPAAATNFYKNIVNLTSYGNTVGYYTNDAGSTGFKPFQDHDIGSFDRGGSLLMGGEANLVDDGNGNVQPPQMFYRVYHEGSVPSVFVPFRLNSIGADTDQPNGQKWSSRSANINLLNAANAGNGRYILEVYFTFNIISNNGDSDGFDRSELNPYTAYFTVDENSTIPTEWTGKNSSVWTDAGNWSPAKIPGNGTNVVIPFISSGNKPIITTGVTAKVRSLFIAGDAAQQTDYHALTITGGELQLYGDFQDPRGSLSQTGGIFALAANATQVFDGGTFTNLLVSGGSTKILSGHAAILESLTFDQSGGIVQTRTDVPQTYNIDLATKARIVDETEVGYVLGVVRVADRMVDQNPNSFGDIGLDLTIANPTNIKASVMRITSFVYNGAGAGKSIRRSFSFSSDNKDNLTFNLNFYYLQAELNGLQEKTLGLFRSLNGGSSFQYLNRTSIDFENKKLTSSGITGPLAATFTLGDAANPLPVTLTNFAAVAQGPDALLTWTTAQELNNAGFEVQVSADGTTFSKLAFVAAVSPNSSETRTYRYSDVSTGKQGTRYYRLRQIDVDGKESLFSPKSVTFGASALAASVKGFPNPFASEINLALQTAAAGPATVSVLDGVGRQVRSWQPTLAAGASNLVLSDLSSLPHGLYVVQVRYNDGQTQRVKVVKE
jgi:hypothetical protein